MKVNGTAVVFYILLSVPSLIVGQSLWRQSPARAGCELRLYLVAPEKPHILPYSYALGYSSSTTYAVKMN